MASPIMVDSVDVNGKTFEQSSLFKAPDRLSVKGLASSAMEDAFAPSHSSNAIHMLAFDFENTSYAIPELEVKGMKNYHFFTRNGAKSGSTSAILDFIT